MIDEIIKSPFKQGYVYTVLHHSDPADPPRTEHFKRIIINKNNSGHLDLSKNHIFPNF